MDNKIIKWNKILEYFGLDENTDKTKKTKGRKQNQDKVVSINRQQEYKVLIYNPDNFKQAKDIVKNLKDRKVVIVNLENNERKISQRILDFISGAICGLNGNIQKIGKEVFIFTPSNIQIDGNKLKEDIQSELLSK